MAKLFLINLFFVVTLFASVETVRVQLNWKPQFEFAAFYVAKEKGFYEKEGIDVEILPGGPHLHRSSAEIVLQGDADVGVDYGGLLADIANGKRLRILGALFEHSPLVLLVKGGRKSTLLDLDGSDVFLNPHEHMRSAVSLMLERSGIRYRRKPFDWNAFLKEPRAAIDQFVGTKSYEMRRRGIPYTIIDPGMYGYDFYGDFLFAREALWQEKPLLMRRFVMATMQGWHYALTHPDETVGILKRTIPDADTGALRYEARHYLPFVTTDAGKIGLLRREKLKLMLERYAEMERIAKAPKIEEMVDPLFLENGSVNLRDRQWMSRHILHYSETDWPPLTIRRGNRLEGIIPDYLQLVYERTGLLMRYVPYGRWSRVLEDVRSRRLDMAAATGVTKERRCYALFTMPYDSYQFAVALPVGQEGFNTPKDMKNLKIAVGRNYTVQAYLRKNFPYIHLVTVENTLEGMRKTVRGEVDGVADIEPVLRYLIGENNFANLQISTPFKEPFVLRGMIRRDYPEAVTVLNKGLMQIGNEEKVQITSRWLPVSVYREKYPWLMWPLAGLAFLVLVMAYLLYRMRREIALRKRVQRDLQEMLDIVDRYVLMSKTDRDGNITYVSSAFCDLTGYAREELMGRDHSLLRNPSTSRELYRKMWETIESGEVWEAEELCNRRKDGSEYWVHAHIVPIMDKKREITGYMAFRRDITPYKKMEELAHRDMLTGFYNRRAFNIMMEERLRELKRKGGGLVFGIYDVDRFKQYNDLYGHQAGDEVLMAISRAVQGVCKRSSDLLFRLGGEEFGIVMEPESDIGIDLCASRIVERVRELRIPHRGNPPYHIVTISLGVVISRIGQGANVRFEEIYSHCDRVMYRVKERGRNGYAMERLNIKREPKGETAEMSAGSGGS
ncbi:diguanylate cyclase [Hydrogenimonas sp. SS33]|uniref:diguanylate cyclase domain-containing protein n=1 Tax=Hydrogenimonas leucolamina TaxID=2954236 RepID=UPI00336BDD7C